MMPPLGTISDGSRVDRSGLNSVHECPLSVVRSTIWQPYNTLSWSNGSIASGGVQWQRYLSLSGGESSPTMDGDTECGVPCMRSKRYNSLPEHDDHTMSGLPGFGIVNPDSQAFGKYW